jgi:hypothetical protein
MRLPLILIATTALSACGGAGPTTVSGAAAPSSGLGTGTGSTPASTHSFVAPTDVKTYSAIGGVQSFKYSTDDRDVLGQYNELYAGDASSARNSGISVTYNPRDAIFDVAIVAPKAIVNQTLRYQDPLHRIDFGGVSVPVAGVPDYTSKGIQYLESGSASGTPGTNGYKADFENFFYQKPGTTTKYVTYAGYVRQNLSIVKVAPESGPAYLQYDRTRERGAFVYGERTVNANVPKTGSATFTGDLLATLVYNPLPDVQLDSPTYFQWMTGTSTTKVNFAANSFTLALTGVVDSPALDSYSSGTHVLTVGSTFAASGAGSIDLVNAGGLVGQFSSASFGIGGVNTPVNIAGSSIDGAFFGPIGQEIGGGFRIVGGTPDQRIDILGAFTGK